MKKASRVNSSEIAKQAIINIGKDLIERAEDITRDLEHVQSITIHAELNPTEVVNYDVNKNYVVMFKDEENEREEN